MKYFAYCRKSSEGEERQALSIPAQVDEIKRIAASTPDVEIVEWFEERMSAKAPGRPVYARMIKRIEKGEANGIVAWHPDRLARNSVDGGWIVHLLDRKVLKNLKFVSYQYEQSPEGMFMLQIMFGQSKYYVDNLAVNVKRGMRKKADMGWWPGKPPTGYLNDRDTRTIVADPTRFALLRQAWEMLLTGTYSVGRIHKRLEADWVYRLPQRRATGGKSLCLNALYKTFANPFYAGIFHWSGQTYRGKHPPMVTLAEFDRAQEILGRPGRPRPSTHSFAFTGSLIRCACGLSITAEEKVKPSGRRYTYYRCSRRLRENCSERAVRLEVIEGAIVEFLESIQISGDAESFILDKIEQGRSTAQARRELRVQSAQSSLATVQQQLRTLVDLRVRDVITDEELAGRREALRSEELRLMPVAQEKLDGPSDPLELARSAISFRKYAVDWFRRGNVDDKRLILETVGSNSVLTGGKLSIQARFPFQPVPISADFAFGWALVGDVRTPTPNSEDVDEEIQLIIENVQTLTERFSGDYHGSDVSSPHPHVYPAPDMGDLQ